MIPGRNYLIRINGKYIKNAYQKTVYKNNEIYHVFQNYQINPNVGYDYVYELVPKGQCAQQAMEERALPIIMKKITGDECFIPF